MTKNDLLFSPLAGKSISLPNGSFVIAEWKDEGGPANPPRFIAPLHVHHSDEEVWYVLEGALRFKLGDREVEAPAGSAVVAPAGVSHTYWNPTPHLSRYLLVMTPNIHRLIQNLHFKDPAQSMDEIFRQHDSEILS